MPSAVPPRSLYMSRLPSTACLAAIVRSPSFNCRWFTCVKYVLPFLKMEYAASNSINITSNLPESKFCRH
jgi:hypothetical protein